MLRAGHAPRLALLAAWLLVLPPAPVRGTPPAPGDPEEGAKKVGKGLAGADLLGISFGRAEAQGNLSDEFGGGIDVTLDYVHGIRSWLGVRLSLGILDYGDALDPNAVRELFQAPVARGDVRFQMLPVTVGLTLAPVAGSRLSPSLYGGVGLYNYQIVMSTSTVEITNRESALGVFGGGDLALRLGTKLSLTAGFTYHYAFSGSSNGDATYMLTGEDRIRLYSAALGIRILLD